MGARHLPEREDMTTVDENFFLHPCSTEFEISSVTIQKEGEEEQTIMVKETITLNPASDDEVCPKYLDVNLYPNLKYVWRKRKLEEGDHVNPYSARTEENSNPLIFQLAMWSLDETTKILDMEWGIGFKE